MTFGYNYPNPEQFIGYICDKCDKGYLKGHLKEKFLHICETFNSFAAMNYFFTELDADLREALIDYAINVYGKKSCTKKYNEFKSIDVEEMACRYNGLTDAEKDRFLSLTGNE